MIVSLCTSKDLKTVLWTHFHNIPAWSQWMLHKQKVMLTTHTTLIKPKITPSLIAQKKQNGALTGTVQEPTPTLKSAVSVDENFVNGCPWVSQMHAK